jgi:hypothetical protein
MVGWFTSYPALVADEPPSMIALTSQSRGGPTPPDVAVGRVRPGQPGLDAASPTAGRWTVRVRGGALAAIGTPNGGTWWEADAAGRAVYLPHDWLTAARAKETVMILAGDIGLDLVTTDADYQAAMNRDVAAGRLLYGLATLDETR